MIDTAYARDLLFIAALFGLVTFVWTGMAQERPPAGVRWRVTLGLGGLAGLGLVGAALPHLIAHWDAPTALIAGTPAFIAYVAVFWLEVLVIIGLAMLYAKTRRMPLFAPTLLIVVGVHFAPLSLVFGQGILMLAAALITAAGVSRCSCPVDASRRASGAACSLAPCSSSPA